MASSAALTTSNKYVKYRIDVSPGNGNVSGNYTPVTVNVFVYRTNTGYTTYGTGTIWCTINGTPYSASITPSQKITNAGIVLFSMSVNIPHNADGTKTLSVTSSLSIPGAGLSSSEQGFSFALTTIPRASTISSVTGNLFGEQITVHIERAAESFTHQVWYKIGASEWFDLGIGYTTSCSFTVDMEKCKYILNSTSETLILCVRTYSGTTHIGSDYYDYSYKIHVPETVVPEIKSITVMEAEDKVAEKFAAFVQNVSKLKIVTEAVGAQGSTVGSCSVEVLGISYSGKEIVTNEITDAGDIVVKVTVKDSRGRSVSRTQNITVIEYISPTISGFSVTRVKEDGTEDAEGEYANCNVKFEISSVADKNTKSYKIEYRRTEQQNWIMMKSGSVYSMDENIISSSAILGSDYAYTVRLTLTDYFTSVTAEINLGTGAPLMDFRGSGKGMAIGKVAEKDCFEVAMDTEFSKRVFLKQGDGIIVDLLEIIPVPVGSILYTEKKYETDPSEDYAWTAWVAIKGRTIVGVDETDTDFNEAGKIGGEKMHKLTVDELPSHSHSITQSHPWNDIVDSHFSIHRVSNSFSSETNMSTGYTGGEQTHNNMQPYYTMYMWLRVA